MTVFLLLLHLLSVFLVKSATFELLTKELPYFIGGPIGTIHNDEIFIINGFCCNKNCYTSSALNLTLPWNTKTDIKMPYNSTRIVYYGQVYHKYINKIYGIPQWSNGVYHYGTNLFTFDLINNAYIDMSTYNNALLRGARFGCVAIVNDIIYIIGGIDEITGGTVHNNLQRYSIINDSWSYGAQLNIPREYSGCVGIGTVIYTFGGRRDYIDVNLSKSIEKYDINNNIWYLLDETLTTPISATTCILHNETLLIYCVGGMYEGNFISKKSNRVEVFNVNTEKIKTDQIIIKTVFNYSYPRLAIYKDYIYILSGAGTPGIQKTFERYKLGTLYPTESPTTDPTLEPTISTLEPTLLPTQHTINPTVNPTIEPTINPTINPTIIPTINPTINPTISPTVKPTKNPTKIPSLNPTKHPTSSSTIDIISYSTSSTIPTKIRSGLNNENDIGMEVFLIAAVVVLVIIIIFIIVVIIWKRKKEKPRSQIEEDKVSSVAMIPTKGNDETYTVQMYHQQNNDTEGANEGVAYTYQ